MKYWLMKSEPEVFSIRDLEKVGKTLWDGVRNYQARNYMREMQVGDRVLFYHSNSNPPGIAGLARVSATAIPDPSQFDKKSGYFEPRATAQNPVWSCAEIEFERAFPKLLPLEEIRRQKRLKDLPLLQKGQRLSVQPVTAHHFKFLLESVEGKT